MREPLAFGAVTSLGIDAHRVPLGYRARDSLERDSRRNRSRFTRQHR